MANALFFFALLSSALHGLDGVWASDTCETDMDCSLNGICTGAVGSRSCQCDVPWQGPQCGVIQVGEAAPGGYSLLGRRGSLFWGVLTFYDILLLVSAVKHIHVGWDLLDH